MVYAPIAKLEKFTGKEDDTQIWLYNVEKAIIANGWNDQPLQQPIQQPPSLQQPIAQMAYAPIAKLEKFSGKEDDTIIANNWDDDATNLWYYNLAQKPQTFDAFKLEFLRYFSNSNSINHLANIFITINQEKTEAVTTYLGCFHKNLCQIQAIQINYFTAPQILNQFIRNLCSSIFQRIYFLHPADFQAIVTNARDFEAAKLEANHAQVVNLVMNGSSKLDSKLKQFTIYHRISHHHHPISHGSKKHVVATIVVNKISNSKPLLKSRLLSTTLYSNSTTTNLPNLSTSYLPATATNNILVTTNSNSTTQSNPNIIWKPKTKNHSAKLKIKDALTNNNNLETSPKQIININISPAIITNNKSLAVIFSFKIKGPTETPFFSKAALDMKSITAMYTDTKVNRQAIKLILDSVDHTASARIITADGAIKTPIGEIDNFPIKINALIGNDWLSKTNAMLDWNTQELQLSQNRQYTRVPATFYQVLWTNTNHNELPPILSWDNKGKEKEKDKPQKDTTNEITSGWGSFYSTDTRPEPSYILLQCKDCRKKLSSIKAWVAPDEDYWT
ncbi:hypothetical protein G9A89_001197 [Geosiphon pyriformis]|nr:hypothetical protein G9A89_001197 [Geosiphon pyriformis]